jgi:hypothetical protein
MIDRSKDHWLKDHPPKGDPISQRMVQRTNPTLTLSGFPVAVCKSGVWEDSVFENNTQRV